MFERKYGTLLVTGTTAIRIPIIKRGVVDYAVSADWTPAAGDVKVDVDGNIANITNLPTAVTEGNTALWEFILTAAETTGKSIRVVIADAATKAVEDQCFIVETFGHASAMYPVDLSASVLPVNVTHFGGTAGTFTTGKPDVQAAASVSGAVGSVTGAVGSVVGNVGGNVNGNVVGSVASVAGNVSGSVGSVSGAVGSVTGSVGSVVGNVGGSTASVTGAVGSVTGNVGGDVSGKVLGGGSGTISGDGVRAASVTGAVGSVTGSVGSVVANVNAVLDSSSVDAIADEVQTRTMLTSFDRLVTVTGAVSDLSPIADNFDTNLPSSVNQFYRDWLIVFTTGPNTGVARPIFSFDGGSAKTITVDEAFPVTPTNGDQFTLVSIHVHSVNTLQSGLATPADVNAQVLDVLSVDTFAELTSPPAATSSLKDKITWLFMYARNKITQTSSQRKLYRDDGSTVAGTSGTSDDGTTFTKGEDA